MRLGKGDVQITVLFGLPIFYKKNQFYSNLNFEIYFYLQCIYIMQIQFNIVIFINILQEFYTSKCLKKVCTFFIYINIIFILHN